MSNKREVAKLVWKALTSKQQQKLMGLSKSGLVTPEFALENVYRVTNNRKILEIVSAQTYGIVLSINTTIRRPSESVQASAVRLERALLKDSVKTASAHDMLANIDYWKQHGKLPSNVDMARVKGKGVYNHGQSRHR